MLAGYQLGIFLPFIIAAAFKTAQGSSTVALVATSALIAPLLYTIGLDSLNGKVLAVMATGAGAMTISHANDSFFWVVTQFSGMDVKTGYKTHTIATLIQGITAMATVFGMSLILL
jgi:gluconate:H+ symporter, GntP family